jgi:acetyl-CoA decarbonylase/synthase complex subunit delta
MAQATAVVEEAIAKQEAETAEISLEPSVEEEPEVTAEVEVEEPEEPAEPEPPTEPAATAEPEAPVVPEPPPAPAAPDKAAELVPDDASGANLLHLAQEAAIRQSLALQQAAAEALRQAELIGKARAKAETPSSPAEAVDALRGALMAALGALGGEALAMPPAAPPVSEEVTEPVVPEVKPSEPPAIDEAAPVIEKAPPAPDKEWLTANYETPLKKEQWSGQVREVTIGATEADGGTRANSVTIGGETVMPFMNFEGEVPHRPVIAFQIKDKQPEDWSPLLSEAWGKDMADPARWAKAAEEAGADLIQLTLDLDNTPETAVATVRCVLEATGLPLFVYGPGQAEKDNELLVPVAEAFKGERLALGVCEDKNYRTIVAAAMANDHLVVARTAMDVNLAKQLNILISDMGLPIERIIMDPTTGALGYGFEYGYSVMERLRLAALQGDSMTQLPMIVTPGEECWKTKESKVGEGVPEEWGAWAERAITWETLTASMLIESGADAVVLRHPESARRVQQAIDDLMS